MATPMYSLKLCTVSVGGAVRDDCSKGFGAVVWRNSGNSFIGRMQWWSHIRRPSWNSKRIREVSLFSQRQRL